MPKNYFDARIAESYDSRWEELQEPSAIDPVVDFLAELAGEGPVLELGVGTGRIAMPLSRKGVRVHGIDLSPEMVAELKRKPGAGAIDVTIGDFATTKVEGSFTLAYLVRNTITNLTTQDDQVRCFQNVAAHLVSGGRFVIEVFVPELRRLPPGETFHAFAVSSTHLGFDEYDPVNQMLVSHHYWVSGGKVETFSAPFRYAWPAELDLMARLAGMSLSQRWTDWDRSAFTNDSRSHVSVWEKTS